MNAPYPLPAVRAQFPALRSGTAFFDGPGGTQTPARVADAVRDALISPVSQRGTGNHAELTADRLVRQARRTMGEFLGVPSDGIAFGRSATQITFDVARAFARELGPNDEIVVTRLDHDANIRPWTHAAELSGARLRWVDFDPETGDIGVDDVRAVLSERTRIVAITAASNLYGSRPDIPAIADIVRSHGALLYLDAVAYTAHALVDLPALGADLVVCSAYKFCGPHLGILGARPELLESLWPHKLRPSTDVVPERFELGTLPYELLAGLAETVEFLASLAPGTATASRREALERSYAALHAQESELFDALIEGLARIPGVRRIGCPANPVPTALFTVEGISPQDAAGALGERDIAIMGGHFYAIEAAERAGLGAGALRAGLAPYTSADDVARLLAEVESLARRSS